MLILFVRPCVYVVVQFYPWFKFSFLLFQTHYHVIIIHYHTQKQKKRKFEPRIKLNHNIYETPIGDVYWAAIHLRFAPQIYCTVLNWEVNQRQIVHSLKRVLTRTSSPFPPNPSQPVLHLPQPRATGTLISKQNVDVPIPVPVPVPVPVPIPVPISDSGFPLFQTPFLSKHAKCKLIPDH